MYNVLNMLLWDNSTRIKRFPKKNFIHHIREEKKGTVPSSVKAHHNRTATMAAVNFPKSQKTLKLKVQSHSRNETIQPLPALPTRDFSARRSSQLVKPALYTRLVPIDKDKLCIDKYRVSRGSVPVTWNEKCITIKKVSINMSPKGKVAPSLMIDTSIPEPVKIPRKTNKYKEDKHIRLSYESFTSNDSCETLYNFYKHTMSPKIV
jgi:hypothetical protein